MSKLETKQDVVERYWPDFLAYCMRMNKLRTGEQFTTQQRVMPTELNFWAWYISSGPLGLKDRGLFYSETEVKYV